jgi:putative Ca2+/H+ antiporter (TMEM165/GDT1 family)
VVEALFVSTAVVALAEFGDKTQLLALVLAARYKRPWPIVAGIALATLANHALAGGLGVWLAGLLGPQALRGLIAGSFFLFGLWALVPDQRPGEPDARAGGVFLTTLVAFFLVEIGDKTQLATVALAARYQALALVVFGTTLGMLVANAPAVWLGERLARAVDLRYLRWAAAASFVVLGALTLVMDPPEVGP